MFHQSIRLLTGRLLSATSGICRQQTSRCSSHPELKIQTDSDSSGDEERWECWQAQSMLLNCFLFTLKLFRVRTSAKTTANPYFLCCVFRPVNAQCTLWFICLLESYKFPNACTFTAPCKKLEANSRRTVRHGSDGQTVMVQLLLILPSTLLVYMKTSHLTLQPPLHLSISSLPQMIIIKKKKTPLPPPVISSSCGHLALTFQTARPQFDEDRVENQTVKTSIPQTLHVLKLGTHDKSFSWFGNHWRLHTEQLFLSVSLVSHWSTNTRLIG